MFDQAALNAPLTQDTLVTVEQVSKMYPIYDQPSDRLKQSLQHLLPGFIKRERTTYFTEFWALRDISFQLKRGEAIGVIGQNGSGKSTLLQLIAGTLTPTTGAINLHGRVAALLELGSGFNPEFTGRENVMLTGTIMGLSRQEIEVRFEKIAAFADIGDFMDQPVKRYSSGMVVRLAFATQTSIEPDILIIDELLSVGDIFFQQKCFERIDTLLQKGTAVILVSHDMGVIEKYSSQTLLLNKGQPLFLGQPNEAVQRYYLVERERHLPSLSSTTTDPLPSQTGNGPEATAWPARLLTPPSAQASYLGNGAARCLGIALCAAAGRPCHLFEMGQTAVFYYEFEVLTDIAVPVGGITLTDALNTNVHGKNSAQTLLAAPAQVRRHSRVRFKQTIQLALAPGHYTFSVGFSTIGAADYNHFADMSYAHFHQKALVLQLVQQAGTFQIVPCQSGMDIPFHGTADLENNFEVAVQGPGS